MITAVVGDVDIAEMQKMFPYATVHLTKGATNNLLVEIPFDANETAVVERLSGISQSVSVRQVGPAIGNIFYQQAMTALIAAFALMAITVFILFRNIMPSFIVLLAVATDITATVAVMNVIGVRLSLPVVAALLTIIGYSVDTDIVLTNELLKGRREPGESVKRAAKTGLTMTVTTLTALAALYFISGSFVLEQIALVLIIGLVIDMPATWFTNAGLLRWLKREH